MEAKLFEVRDVGTFIPVMAIKMFSTDEQELYLLKRSGYSGCDSQVLVSRLEDSELTLFPHQQSSSTMKLAHRHMINCWSELKSGDVIDIEFVMGLSTEKKVSERFNNV
jgi:hypothetical protein